MDTRPRLGPLLTAGLVLSAVAAACADSGTTTSPSSSGASSLTAGAPPALVVDVTVPTHAYSLRLPAGWKVVLGASASDADRFSGLEGTLAVAFTRIDPGMGQDTWAERYEAAQVQAFAPGCFSGPSAPYIPARIGSESGFLFEVPCLPGWMLLTAYGDRGYDVRFTQSGVATSADGKALLLAILASVSFGAST